VELMIEIVYMVSTSLVIAWLLTDDQRSHKVDRDEDMTTNVEHRA
jgi:hypothetical protein